MIYQGPTISRSIFFPCMPVYLRCSLRVKSEIIVGDLLESERGLAVINARNTRAGVFVQTHFFDIQGTSNTK